jgi:hypothetical protein
MQATPLSCRARVFELLLLAKECTHSLDVSRKDGQRHIALESHDLVVPAALQSMYLQRIDGGFHRAVLLRSLTNSGALSLARSAALSRPFLGITT